MGKKMSKPQEEKKDILLEKIRKGIAINGFWGEEGVKNRVKTLKIDGLNLQ